MSDELTIAALNADTGKVEVRPMTQTEAAAFLASRPDPVEAEAQLSKLQSATANADTMRVRVEQNLAALKAAADKMAGGGVVTAAEQRAALALALRTTVQLGRLVLGRLDAAD